MRIRDGDAGWLVAYILVGGFFVFAILHFPALHQMACTNGETDCFRQWVSALSGWFGAIAAFGTIVFVIRQIDEQKRQTDFMLGDAMPTMDVTPDLDDAEQMVVRIVNWNRRGIIVRAIAANIEGHMGVLEIKQNGHTMPLSGPRWPMPVHGWEDRNTCGPSVLQLKIAMSTRRGILSDWPRHAEITATIHILGDRHQIKQLVAAVHP